MTSMVKITEKQKNNELYQLASELRLPLSEILAYTELLQQELQVTRQKELLTNIQSAVEFILGVTDNLLGKGNIETSNLNFGVDQHASGQPPTSAQSMEGQGTTVLVVDDDPITLEYITVVLRHNGYKVSTAINGKDAIKLAEVLRPDLVILDWVLPDAQGPDICMRIRNLIDPVIVMLSGRAALDDKVIGLQAGADDYQTKPFHFKELLARIESLLRRRGVKTAKKVLRFANLTLCPERREVWQGEKRLSLTPTEFDLLHLFMCNPYHVLPKVNIMQSVWGSSYVGDVNVVEVYIGYLRRKLGKPSPIKTVRGVGYVLEE